MDKTTIQINTGTLARLKMLKRYERESYDEVLNSLLNNVEEEVLSAQEVIEINEALENVRSGKEKPIEQVAKELAISLN